MWFSKDTFFQMLQSGWIVDGRSGGFVIGRSHNGGNIYMIQEIEEEKFIISGDLEGGEYIINFEAYISNKDRIEQINDFQETQETLTLVKISPKTKILNTHAEPFDKLLWIDFRGQFIVNKKATFKFFDEIEEINSIKNGFSACDLNVLVQKEES